MSEMRCRYCGEELTESALRHGGYCPQGPNNKHELAAAAGMRCCYCGEELTESTLRHGGYCPQSPNNKHLLL
jgi:ribosomal protein S27E